MLGRPAEAVNPQPSHGLTPERACSLGDGPHDAPVIGGLLFDVRRSRGTMDVEIIKSDLGWMHTHGIAELGFIEGMNLLLQGHPEASKEKIRDYETPDGTCIRDYIHVADLADAHLVALEALENVRGSAVFNVGTGQGHSVREVIRTAEEVSGRAIPVQEGSRRPGDPLVLVADGGRLWEIGWRPRYGLRDIVASAWDWHPREGW